MNRIFEGAERGFERFAAYFAAHPKLAYLLIAAIFAVWLTGAILNKPWATEEPYLYARQRFDPTTQWLGPKAFRIYLILMLGVAVAACLFLYLIS